MKKALSVILPLIFLFNLGGYYLWFSIKQYLIQQEVKQEIRKGLDDNALSLVVIDSDKISGLHWIKPGKEFIHAGKMYDVVKTRISGSKSYFYCINDVREKQLIGSFQQNSNLKKEIQKQFKRISNYNFVPQFTRIVFQVFGTGYDYAALKIFLNSISPDIPSPPPKQFMF